MRVSNQEFVWEAEGAARTNRITPAAYRKWWSVWKLGRIIKSVLILSMCALLLASPAAVAQQRPVNKELSALTERLHELAKGLTLKTENFSASLKNFNSEESMARRQVIKELVAKHFDITKKIGDRIGNLQQEQENVSAFKELAAFSADFTKRVKIHAQGLDKIDIWEKDLTELISKYNSLLAPYLDQINFVGNIVKGFGDQVKAARECAMCMDIEKYEALIKSYQDTLKNWGELLQTAEGLLRGKKELWYLLPKNRAELLKSYEELVKSAIEIEDKWLDLLNKSYRRILVT